jgi:hypothetical protein
VPLYNDLDDLNVTNYTPDPSTVTSKLGERFQKRAPQRSWWYQQDLTPYTKEGTTNLFGLNDALKTLSQPMWFGMFELSSYASFPEDQEIMIYLIDTGVNPDAGVSFLKIFLVVSY